MDRLLSCDHFTHECFTDYPRLLEAYFLTVSQRGKSYICHSCEVVLSIGRAPADVLIHHFKWHGKINFSKIKSLKCTVLTESSESDNGENSYSVYIFLCDLARPIYRLNIGISYVERITIQRGYELGDLGGRVTRYEKTLFSYKDSLENRTPSLAERQYGCFIIKELYFCFSFTRSWRYQEWMHASRS